MVEIERRGATEVRATGRRLSGVAAPFNVEAKIGSFSETIAPGAFAETLAGGRDVLALVDHNPGRLLARTKSGTLALEEGAAGLTFDLSLPETADGNDILALASRGDLGGVSIGFRAVDEFWTGNRRELRAVDLVEISVVQSWPAYEGTTVSLRARPGQRLVRARLYLETCK